MAETTDRSDIDRLVAEVDSSPEGPHVGAFFDFDGTLIDGYSAVMYFRERLRTRDVGLGELLRTAIESVNVERRDRRHCRRRRRLSGQGQPQQQQLRRD